MRIGLMRADAGARADKRRRGRAFTRRRPAPPALTFRIVFEPESSGTWALVDLDTGYEYTGPIPESGEGFHVVRRDHASDFEESLISSWRPAEDMPAWCPETTAPDSTKGAR